MEKENQVLKFRKFSLFLYGIPTLLNTLCTLVQRKNFKTFCCIGGVQYLPVLGWGGNRRFNLHSQVLVVKNLPASARDIRDMGLVPGL